MQVHQRSEAQGRRALSKITGKIILFASGHEDIDLLTSVRGLNSFVNYDKRIILPILNKIQEARDVIRLATRNEPDLLEKLEYQSLKELLDGREDKDT